jgi:tyrosyl-tRNA synthetase
MFGKLLSISDDLMWDYFTLLSFRPMSEIDLMKQEVAAGRNPKDCKVLLAQEIVARFHSQAAAEKALEDFNHRAKGGVPDEIPEVNLSGAPMVVANLLKAAGLAPSTSEAMRNIKQNGVKINGQTIADKQAKIDAGTYIVQVGKRKFAKVTLT